MNPLDRWRNSIRNGSLKGPLPHTPTPKQEFFIFYFPTTRSKWRLVPW